MKLHVLLKWVGFLVVICLSVMSAFALVNDAELAWTFDTVNKIGNTLHDVSGFDNDATINGASSNQAGICNESFYFDGINDYLNKTNITGDWKTISVWFKPVVPITTTTGRTALFGDVSTGDPKLEFSHWTSELTNEMISLGHSSGAADVFYWTSATVPTISNTTWTHLVFIWNASATNYNLYINGSFIGAATKYNTPTLLTTSTDFGRGNSQYYKGFADMFLIYNTSKTSADVAALYNGGACYNPYLAVPPVYKLVVRAGDLYDNASISGLTVTLANGTSGTTNVTGEIGFITTNGATSSFNITDPIGRYFDYESSTNVTTATKKNVYLTGARVTFRARDLLNNTLYNISATPDQASKYNITTTGNLTMILKPNATNNITFMVSDGVNLSLNNTWLNQTISINITAQDVSIYNITEFYKILLNINVSVGKTSTYLYNFSVNVSESNSSFFLRQNTTTQNTIFRLMPGDYSIFVDAEGYAYQTINYTFYERLNMTANITIPVYNINSFYLILRNEITRSEITELMYIDLISDVYASRINTTNGSASFELLTPADYTIRYWNINHTERDYYETIFNRNYFDVNLYSLRATERYIAVFTVVDTSGDPVEGAIVKLLRYYVYCNCYETVEMAETSYNGEALFSVDGYNGHYKIIVELDDTTKFISTSPENFVPDYNNEIKRTITINTGTNYYESLQILPSIGRSLTYNNATHALTFTWNDPSSLTSRGCLKAQYINGIHYETYAESCQNASSGSVIIILNNTNTTTYKYTAYIETNTAYSEYSLFNGFIDKPISDTFLNYGRFLAAGVIIVLGSMAAMVSAVATLIIATVGVIIMSFLGLFTISTSFMVGLSTLIIGSVIFIMRK